jgi:hypothetical protein
VQITGKDPNKSSLRRLETISRENGNLQVEGVRKSFVKSNIKNEYENTKETSIKRAGAGNSAQK